MRGNKLASCVTLTFTCLVWIHCWFSSPFTQGIILTISLPIPWILSLSSPKTAQESSRLMYRSCHLTGHWNLKLASNVDMFIYFFACSLIEKDKLWLQMNYYAWKMRALRSQCSSPQMSNRHPCLLKQSKSWGAFWSYHLNSTANPAHLPQKWAKLAELAVLFIW